MEASVTITARVRDVVRRVISEAETSPFLRGAYLTVTPLPFKYSSGRSTELCSATVVTTSSPAFNVPRIAMLSASVQFLVKIVLS